MGPPVYYRKRAYMEQRHDFEGLSLTFCSGAANHSQFSELSKERREELQRQLAACMQDIVSLIEGGWGMYLNPIEDFRTGKVR